MLPSSDFTITLNKSTDYLRVALIIHGLAIIILLNSALPSLVLFPSVLALLLFLLRSISRPPLPLYGRLSYHAGSWLLHRVNGQYTQYKRATIDFDGGLFILLTLSDSSPTKKLVIFNDQITEAQYRVLKFTIATSKPSLHS